MKDTKFLCAASTVHNYMFNASSSGMVNTADLLPHVFQVVNTMQYAREMVALI